jgi:uncharacterized protein (TIGR02145 family)
MKSKNIQFVLLLLLVVIIIICCEKDRKWDSPYDPKVDPALWMPDSLKIKQIAIDKVELTWHQGDLRIDGFKLERNENNTNWQLIATLDKKTFTFIDNISSKQFSYRLFAYAGKNNSYEAETTIIPLSITTVPVTSITATTCTSGGNIFADSGNVIIAKGVCWNTSPNPTIANNKTSEGFGTESFVSQLTGLTQNTTYYVRAYITKSAGTNYGNEVSFKTSDINFNPNLTYGTVTDIEGNVYKTIIIGTQTWMAENLKTTKYNDGNIIPNVIDNNVWTELTTGAYCWYNNDPSKYKATYGAFYNWYTVADSRKVCPVGWHVPSDAEWTVLTNYLGGESIAGGKMKEVGLTHWNSQNIGATNQSGFTGLPSGYRYHWDGTFHSLGSYGNFWIGAQADDSNAWYRNLYYGYADCSRYSFRAGSPFGA